MITYSRSQSFYPLFPKQIQAANIDGVIAAYIEFCDLHGCQNMILEHELEKIDIPILSLDRDYFLGDVGRFKTRAEAFVEQIE